MKWLVQMTGPYLQNYPSSPPSFLPPLLLLGCVLFSVAPSCSRWHQAGYEAGIEHGRLEGRVDGFTTGQLKGMEIGDEVVLTCLPSLHSMHAYVSAYIGGVLPRFCWRDVRFNLEGKDKLKRWLVVSGALVASRCLFLFVRSMWCSHRQLLALLEDIKGFRCLDFNSSTYHEDLRRMRGRFRQVGGAERSVAGE